MLTGESDRPTDREGLGRARSVTVTSGSHRDLQIGRRRFPGRVRPGVVAFTTLASVITEQGELTMGLIQAALGALGGTLADQWKDFYTVPDGLSPTAALFAAVPRGQNAGRGSNTKGSDGVITNGSRIVVPEGYGLLLTEQGAITGFAAEPGAQSTAMLSTQPSPCSATCTGAESRLSPPELRSVSAMCVICSRTSARRIAASSKVASSTLPSIHAAAAQ